MAQLDKMQTDGTFETMSKKERLMKTRERAKLEIQFGSIADLTRLPAALFIVDITKEHIAVAEAHRLNIPTYAIVDTNSDPNKVDFAIPANDDAASSVAHITEVICKAIAEGLSERKLDKEASASDEKEGKSAEEVENADNNVAFSASGEEEEGGAAGQGKRRRRTTTQKK